MMLPLIKPLQFPVMTGSLESEFLSAGQIKAEDVRAAYSRLVRRRKLPLLNAMWRGFLKTKRTAHQHIRIPAIGFMITVAKRSRSIDLMSSQELKDVRMRSRRCWWSTEQTERCQDWKKPGLRSHVNAA